MGAISSATATPAVTVSFMGNGSSSLMPQVAASCHFEDPFQPAGCQTGELNITVQGVTGSFCAPKCDASGACPTDTCAGTVANHSAFSKMALATTTAPSCAILRPRRLPAPPTSTWPVNPSKAPDSAPTTHRSAE